MKLLKFYTNTCSQCKMMNRVLDGFDLVPIEHIDCEDDPEDLATKFQIRSLPTLVLVDDGGEFLRKFTRYIAREDIERIIRSELNNE